MVYNAGGYRFSDYLRIGIPLDLIFLIVTVGIAPLVWPFHPSPQSDSAGFGCPTSSKRKQVGHLRPILLLALRACILADCCRT